MKRDMDLAREILLIMEAHEEPNDFFHVTVDGYTGQEVSYHLELLYQAKLIEAINVTSTGGYGWMAKSLTWQGHEFLDAARNDSIWKKAKDFIISKGGSLTLEILKAVLSEEMRKAVMGI